MMHKIIDFFRDYPAVREWDDNGLLNSAGFTWKEIAWPVFQVFGTGAFVLYFYALGCMSDKRTPPEFTKMVVLAGVGCVLACIFMGRIKRWDKLTAYTTVTLEIIELASVSSYLDEASLDFAVIEAVRRQVSDLGRELYRRISTMGAPDADNTFEQGVTTVGQAFGFLLLAGYAVYKARVLRGQISWLESQPPQ